MCWGPVACLSCSLLLSGLNKRSRVKKIPSYIFGGFLGCPKKSSGVLTGKGRIFSVFKLETFRWGEIGEVGWVKPGRQQKINKWKRRELGDCGDCRMILPRSMHRQSCWSIFLKSAMGDHHNSCKTSIPWKNIKIYHYIRIGASNCQRALH